MFLRQDENVTLCQDGWLSLRASSFSKQIQFWIWVLGILTDGIKAALPMVLRNCLWYKQPHSHYFLPIDFYLWVRVGVLHPLSLYLFSFKVTPSTPVVLSSHPSSGQSQFFVVIVVVFSPVAQTSPDLNSELWCGKLLIVSGWIYVKCIQNSVGLKQTPDFNSVSFHRFPALVMGNSTLPVTQDKLILVDFLFLTSHM